MNIEKASYHTIVMFGKKDDLINKLNLENKALLDIVNLKNDDDVSLLEIALIYRKFELAKLFLSNGASVNNVSKEKNNEFHYLASNLHIEGAIECAYILLEMGADLSLQNKKYANSAMFALCLEALKRPSQIVNRFICDCLLKNQGIEEKNMRGYNVRMLIEDRGTDEMKRILKII